MLDKFFGEAEKRYLGSIEDYKIVFESEHGKRVLYDLMQKHNVLKSTFSENPHEMAYKEGQRKVILDILSTIKFDVKALENEMKEKAREHTNRGVNIYK